MTFTHFDKSGKAHMVDVGDKDVTARSAVAEGRILMQDATLQSILAGDHKKGDVLGVARLAGIMAAKKTADAIPLCHPLSLSSVSVDFKPSESPAAIVCSCQVKTRERTGVEMEALHAVQIALLSIYDMCKSADRGMVIGDIKLLEKHGGKSGSWQQESTL